MGIHVIAEQMYRHGPATMLYASLRIAIYADPHGNGRFIVDQPSTCFSSFDPSDIAGACQSSCVSNRGPTLSLENSERITR
jgi:hypothetical protein